MKFKPLDFARLRTYPLKERANKVGRSDFAAVHRKGESFCDFWRNLPAFLAVRDLRAVVAAIVNALENERPVLLMMGAHPVKCGLNPVIVEMMKAGVISAVAFNGAGAIHDFELAYQGETSEDVQAGLDDGTFGMVEETSRLMNQALEKGVVQGVGAGRALGDAILARKLENAELSILATGAAREIPVTVHIAIGTDIIHQHPTANGAVLGESSFRDFQNLAAVVAELDGGVALNVGSAVIMPEVFLKALAIARNLGHEVRTFTTATFDMIRHYRPLENVVRRPTHLGGAGYYLIGHHEIMIPLLFAAVVEELGK
jgi:deoxyhypusine synthase